MRNFAENLPWESLWESHRVCLIIEILLGICLIIQSRYRRDKHTHTRDSWDVELKIRLSLEKGGKGVLWALASEWSRTGSNFSICEKFHFLQSGVECSVGELFRIKLNLTRESEKWKVCNIVLSWRFQEKILALCFLYQLKRASWVHGSKLNSLKTQNFVVVRKWKGFHSVCCCCWTQFDGIFKAFSRTATPSQPADTGEKTNWIIQFRRDISR